MPWLVYTSYEVPVILRLFANQAYLRLLFHEVYALVTTDNIIFTDYVIATDNVKSDNEINW